MYDTVEAAQADIDDCIADTAEAYQQGDLCEQYDPYDYRIVAVANPHNAFSDEELLVILEAARIAMADATIADMMVDQMDLDDDTFSDITERLQKVMGDPRVEVEY